MTGNGGAPSYGCSPDLKQVIDASVTESERADRIVASDFGRSTAVDDVSEGSRAAPCLGTNPVHTGHGAISARSS